MQLGKLPFERDTLAFADKLALPALLYQGTED
jgi:hypothetical protein